MQVCYVALQHGMTSDVLVANQGFYGLGVRNKSYLHNKKKLQKVVHNYSKRTG